MEDELNVDVFTGSGGDLHHWTWFCLIALLSFPFLLSLFVISSSF